MDIIKASLMAAVSQGGGANLGTKTITANGTYTAQTDGYDGYSSVTVDVPQQGGGNLGQKIIEQDGIYRASDDGLDGYDIVIVNTNGGVRSGGVAHGNGLTITQDIIIENTDIVLQNLFTQTFPADTENFTVYVYVTDVTTGAYTGSIIYNATSTGQTTIPLSGTSIYMSQKWGKTRPGIWAGWGRNNPPPWNF